MDNDTLAARFGAQEDSLQIRTWSHCMTGFSFECVACCEDDEMDGSSTSLFSGEDRLGDLCHNCAHVRP